MTAARRARRRGEPPSLLPLDEGEPVAGVVAHQRLDAVEAIRRRLDELHAAGLQLLVGGAAVGCLEDADAERAKADALREQAETAEAELVAERDQTASLKKRIEEVKELLTGVLRSQR